MRSENVLWHYSEALNYAFITEKHFLGFTILECLQCISNFINIEVVNSIKKAMEPLFRLKFYIKQICLLKTHIT